MRELEFTPAEISVYYGERLPKLPQRGREWRGPSPIHDRTRKEAMLQFERSLWREGE